MNLCKTCGTICPFDDERTECDAYAPMTNENWFISLPTEEKAKWLSNHSAFIYECGQKQNTPKVMYEEDWEWWLKQPHTTE